MTLYVAINTVTGARSLPFWSMTAACLFIIAQANMADWRVEQEVAP
jgi:hypothetical protein